jgi:hypothetical protein
MTPEEQGVEDTFDASSDSDDETHGDGEQTKQPLPHKLQSKLKAAQQAVAAGGSTGRGLSASLLNQAAARWGVLKKALLGLNRWVAE